MNRKTLFAAAAFATLVATSAQAVQPYDEPGYPTVSTSSLTRAEVQQAAVAARLAGQIVDHDGTYIAPTAPSMLTRAQVRAETLEAMRLGLVSHGERHVFPTDAQLDSIRMAGERAAAMQMARK